MFSLILNVVGTLLHAYVAWGLLRLPGLRRRVGVWRWSVAALLVWGLYVVGVQIGDDGRALPAVLLAQFAMHWLAVLFLLALPLLVLDLASGFGLWWRPYLSRLRLTALAVGVALVAVALVQGIRAPLVSHYTVALDGLPAALDGTRIVALSDLHLGASLDAQWLRARARQAAELEPDAVVLLGDLVEEGPETVPGLEAALRAFSAPLGVWAVTGNHEFHGETAETIALFERAGIRWLRNESVEVAPGLFLAGVDYPHRRGESPPALAAFLPPEPETATLLLSHAPDRVQEAAAAGADLMLSGHTHAGQIWPFGFLVQRAYPYFQGRYEVAGLSVIVGRGTGTWGPRMRLWRPGEILALTLRTESNDTP